MHIGVETFPNLLHRYLVYPRSMRLPQQFPSIMMLPWLTKYTVPPQASRMSKRLSTQPRNGRPHTEALTKVEFPDLRRIQTISSGTSHGSDTTVPATNPLSSQPSSSQPPKSSSQPSSPPSNLKLPKPSPNTPARKQGVSKGYLSKDKAEFAAEAWAKCFATYNPFCSPIKFDLARNEWYFYFERDS